MKNSKNGFFSFLFAKNFFFFFFKVDLQNILYFNNTIKFQKFNVQNIEDYHKTANVMIN